MGLTRRTFTKELKLAAIQRLEIGIHPTYFNHNALYHLLQAVGLVLLLIAFRGLIMGGNSSTTEILLAAD